MQQRFSASRATSTLVPLVTLTVLLGSAPRANAQTVQTVYSNITNYTGSAVANAGAATSTGTTALTTTTIADDINLAAGATGAIKSFQFTVANFNATAVSARPILSFYTEDPNTGNPTTLLYEVIFNPISFPASNLGLYTFAPTGGATLFNAPTDGFWAAETFDNGGTASATTATQLNNLGLGIFNPATIGESDDVFYQSTGVGPSVYNGNSPAGGLYYFGPSGPVASFGFTFTGLSTAPEPSAVALSLAGGLLTLGGFLRRRRKVK